MLLQPFSSLIKIAVIAISIASTGLLTGNAREIACDPLTPSLREINAKLALRIANPTKHSIEELVRPLVYGEHCERLAAAEALRSIGTGAEDATPHLIEILENSEEDRDLRIISLLAIRSIDALPALPSLIKLVERQSDDTQVRTEAATALLSLGSKGIEAVPALLRMSKSDLSSTARSAAIQSIGVIEREAIVQRRENLLPGISRSDIDTIRVFIDILESDPSWPVRRYAAEQLGGTAQVSRDNQNDRKMLSEIFRSSVPILVNQLQNPNTTMRFHVVQALGFLGSDAVSSVPVLEEIMQDQTNLRIRSSIVNTLAKIGKPSQTLISRLHKLIKGKESAEVKQAAAAALGSFDVTDRESINALHHALKETNLIVRDTAISSIRTIANNFRANNIANSNHFTADDIHRIIATLNEIHGKAEKSSEPEQDGVVLAISSLEQLVIKMETSEKKLRWNSFVNFLASFNPAVHAPLSATWTAILAIDLLLVVFLLATVLNLLSIILLLLRPMPYCSKAPLLLLWASEVLKPIRIPIKLLGIDYIAPANLLLFSYHTRVLDAWVEAQQPQWYNSYSQKDVVRDRQAYVPIPVILDRKPLSYLSPSELRNIFDNVGCLLIWGEGGSGKTTLACQLGYWAMGSPKNRLQPHIMLPILIQNDLDETQDNPIHHAILCQLKYGLASTTILNEQLLQHLLTKKRILVIVDALSEMGEQSKRFICPEKLNFNIPALVVTSRNEETLGYATKSVVKPQYIHGTGLSAFIESYFVMRRVRDYFSDHELYDSCCSLLTAMDEEAMEFTPMLLKLYADRLIASRQQNTQVEHENNVPSLMLDYINRINSNVSQTDRLPNVLVQQDVKVIAWCCLKARFSPGSAAIADVLAALQKEDVAKQDMPKPELRLRYLIDQLELLHLREPVETEVYFNLNVLVEYFAALFVLQSNTISGVREWQSISHRLEFVPIGFLVALRSCARFLNDSDVTEQLSTVIANRKAGLIPQVPSQQNPKENKIMETS
jgi:HEAT repeat protein